MATEDHGQLLIPIDAVPLGARVLTRNPRPWEYDDSLPEPVQATWSKLCISMQRIDGGIVEAEILRPQAWIAANGIKAGQELPMHLEELQTRGTARVTAIQPCPEIAEGAGSVITARFLTREVQTIARVKILAGDGSSEWLEGTTIHPIWSEDRQDWVPLGELVVGEQLRAASGLATVLAIHLVHQPTSVYNLEVHGEHVYQVGNLALLVHNAYPGAAGGAFEIAQQGGKHAGFLQNYLGKPASQIQKGIRSIEKEIADHLDKIANPRNHFPDWDTFDPRRQEALLNRIWPSDIARQREQMDILQGLLRSMGGGS